MGHSVLLKQKQTLTTKNAWLAESSNKGIILINTTFTDDVGTVHEMSVDMKCLFRLTARCTRYLRYGLYCDVNIKTTFEVATVPDIY